MHNNNNNNTIALFFHYLTIVFGNIIMQCTRTNKVSTRIVVLSCNCK